jgi:hypothetical protein
VTLKQWNYWDGKIIKGPDGKYHLFCSRWDQARGHNDWWNSKAIHAVSDNLYGPYVDKGLCWPESDGGKGHNVTALQLADGRYAIVISETRPGTVYVSKSLDGPWELLGKITVDGNPKWRASNEIILLRPDGNYEMFGRPGIVMISTNGVLGPYVAQGPSIYPGIAGMPQHDRQNLEDPVLWFSGGFYHVTVNNWSDRKAYHLTSTNGIDGWVYRGLAYTPAQDFLRYTDGTVNRWPKLERPGIYMENGHVVAITLAVIDVEKEQQHGNDGHGSKIIVIPFDGKALDSDLNEPATLPGQTADALAPDSETGNITYTLKRVENPTAEQQKIYDQIDKSTKAAVGYYNRYTKLKKHVTVFYNPGVPTADGNINGTIRIGSLRNTRTLLHEIGHVMGVGQDRDWNKLIVDHLWQGREANKLLQDFVHDPQAQLHADRMHFWPYGLNYDSEVKSKEDFIRHARLVEAIVKDLEDVKLTVRR